MKGRNGAGDGATRIIKQGCSFLITCGRYLRNHLKVFEKSFDFIFKLRYDIDRFFLREMVNDVRNITTKQFYMEPLCTIPEYRHMGLAAAALSENYHRMKALGAIHMTGGSNPFYKN